MEFVIMHLYFLKYSERVKGALRPSNAKSWYMDDFKYKFNKRNVLYICRQCSQA